jgi:tetratricopeptide (TPR) repeat protein
MAIGSDLNSPGNLGVTLCRLEQFDEAIPYLLLSLRIKDTNRWFIYYNLGAALMRTGRPDEAVPHLAQAVRMAPDEAIARAAYGFALLHQRRVGPALAELRAALRLQPGPLAMRHVAWALATHNDPRHRDPAEAVRLAEAARELTGARDAHVLDALAAAYADAGRTEDAVRVGLLAEELADKAGALQLARDVRRRVDECYRAGRPFRETAAASVVRPAGDQGEARITEP